MRTLLTGIAALSLTTACVELSGTTSSNVEGDEGDGAGGGDTDECKIEGSQIGRENLVMDLGNKTVTFTDWVAKPGSNGEYNGFTITVSGATSISYIVKAGTQRFASTTMSWTHPSGLSANAISNVDFCEGDDGGGDGGGDDGGGDGCIEGCDDGSGDDGGGDGGGDGGFDGPGGDDGTGICFEPGGCDGAGGDLPPLTDGGGDGGGDGCIEGCDGPIL